MSAFDRRDTSFVELKGRYLNHRPDFLRSVFNTPFNAGMYSRSNEFSLMGILVRENAEFCEVIISEHEIVREIINRNVVINGMDQIYSNSRTADEYCLKIRKSACVIRRQTSGGNMVEEKYMEPDTKICFEKADRRRLIQLI